MRTGWLIVPLLRAQVSDVNIEIGAWRHRSSRSQYPETRGRKNRECCASLAETIKPRRSQYLEQAAPHSIRIVVLKNIWIMNSADTEQFTVFYLLDGSECWWEYFSLVLIFIVIVRITQKKNNIQIVDKWIMAADAKTLSYKIQIHKTHKIIQEWQ